MTLLPQCRFIMRETWQVMRRLLKSLRRCADGQQRRSEYFAVYFNALMSALMLLRMILMPMTHL